MVVCRGGGMIGGVNGGSGIEEVDGVLWRIE